MTLDALIMGTGGLIALLAVLPRFPETIDTAIFFVLGAVVVALGIVVRRRLNRPKQEPHHQQTSVVALNTAPSAPAEMSL